MAIVFVLVITFLIVLLFLVPKLLQKQKSPKVSSPLKQKKRNDGCGEQIEILNRLFENKESKNQSIITFREINEEYLDVLVRLVDKYELICLSKEQFTLKGIRCMQYSNDTGLSAIVRSLKPKVHVDNQQYENLHNFVKIINWDCLNRLL